MLLNNVADKLVFKFLSKINYGYLELTTFDGNVLKFGNPNDKLQANILIKKQNFNYKPSTSVEDGVSNFVKWFKDYYKI